MITNSTRRFVKSAVPNCAENKHDSTADCLRRVWNFLNYPAVFHRLDETQFEETVKSHLRRHKNQFKDGRQKLEYSSIVHRERRLLFL